MKQETILQGVDLLKKIEAIQKTKTHLDAADKIDLSSNQSGTVISIRPDLVPVSISVNNAPNCPNELKEQIKEETIRFIQRCKRHCDDFEFKLKQELEDLA